MISRAAAAETETPSEEVPAAITDRQLAPTAVAAPRAWDLEAAAEAEVAPGVVAVVVGGEDRR